MPRLIRFEPEHIFMVQNRDGTNPELLQRGISLLQEGYYLAYSAAIGEKIIACAGMCIGIAFKETGETVKDPKGGYVWVIVSPEIENYKVWFHREVRKYFWAIVRDFKLSCITAGSLKTSVRNCRWLERLGFKAEGEYAVQGEPRLRYVLRIAE